jgi:hypothetical protein
VRYLRSLTAVSVRPVYDGMPGYWDVIERLNALGFELSALFPVTLDDKLRVIEFDCVMIRACRASGRTSRMGLSRGRGG